MNKGFDTAQIPLYSAPRLAFGKGRYARPPAGGCQSPAVTAPPRGGAKTYLRTCIGAFLPLPAGEVAARSADGEGKTRDVQRPSPTSVLSEVIHTGEYAQKGFMSYA